MKTLLLGLGILMISSLFIGCDQSQLSKNQLQNQVRQQEDVQEKSYNGNGRRGGRNFVKSDYVVDNSDKLQPRILLETAKQGKINTEEKAGLIQMREEEKLAHDVYITMYEKWGQNIFNNISGSEQTHTDTIKYLLDEYGIVDPVVDTKVGVFTDSEMTKLYNSLVEQGSKSLVDALIVGATVEDLDIKDLEKLLPKTDNEDIKIAYQNLNKGSRNHLRAFMRNLERNGGTYVPQFISQTRFDEILAGEQERGSVNAKGIQSGLEQGNGNKKGQLNGKRGQGNGQVRNVVR